MPTLVITALTLLTFCLLSATAPPHIHHIDVNNIPSFHQKDFVESLSVPHKRREVLDLGDNYFRLNGLHLDGEHHDFILKQDPNVNAPIYVDGELLDAPTNPVFHGYHADDFHTIIAFTFPSLHNGDANTSGHVIWSHGEAHHVVHHVEHGLSMKEQDNVQMVNPHVLEHEDIEDAFLPLPQPGKRTKKRQNVNSGSGVDPSATMLTLTLLCETDNGFLSNWGGDTSQGSDYIRVVVSTANIVEIRDLRIQWKIYGINLHPNGGAPASDYSTLGSWMKQNPIAGLGAAGIFQKSGNSGVGYVGTICGSTPTFHVPVSLTDLFWKALSILHESGHVLAAAHTHDGPSSQSVCAWSSRGSVVTVDDCAFGPHVDECGSTGALPSDGVGVIMSYCHTVGGYSHLQLVHGLVGAHGINSERVSQKMRAKVVSKGCGVPDNTGPNGPAVYSPPGKVPSATIPPSPRPPTPNPTPTPTPVPRPPTPTPVPRPPTPTPVPRPPTPNPTPTPVPRPPTPTGSCTDVLPRVNQFSWNGQAASCDRVKTQGWCNSAATWNPPVCANTCGNCRKRAANTDKVLFSQGDSCTASQGIPTAYYETMQAHARALDDFVVPKGKVWTISSVEVMGRWEGKVPTSLTWSITIFNRDHIMCKSYAKVVPNGKTDVTKLQFQYPCNVVGGHLDDAENVEEDETYYVTVTPHVDSDIMWYWSFSTTKKGAQIRFKDEAYVFNDKNNNLPTNKAPCRRWDDPSKCGFTTLQHDLCFTVYGSESQIDGSSWEHLDVPVSPVRDGGIGTDHGHPRLLSVEEAHTRVSECSKIRDTHKVIEAQQSQSVEEPKSIERVKAENSDTSYMVPLVVLGSICFVLCVIILIVMVFRRTNKQSESF